MSKEHHIIFFNGKNILRNKIISFYMKEYKVFPYLRPFQCFRFIKRFPFIKQYSFPLNFFVTRWCVEIEMDNGKIFRKWYYNEGHKGGYGSGTNADSGLSKLYSQFNSYSKSEEKENTLV